MDEQRLARMEALLEALVEKVDKQIEKATEWREKTDRMLYGDGNGYKGILIRIDRLEQDQQRSEKAQERQKKMVATVGGGLLLLALKSIWGLLVG